MTSSPHAFYIRGYTRVTMGVTKRSELVKWSVSQKSSHSSDWGLQLDPMKVESLVIVDQNVPGEYVPALYTPPVCPWEWTGAEIVE